MAETLSLPVVPMKNAVLLPGVSFPITAGRPATLRAIEAALNDKDRRVFAVAQRQVTEGEVVTPDTLYTIGTIATVGSIQRSLGSVLLLLEGRARGIATRFVSKEGRLEATVQEAREMLELDSGDPAFVALHHEVRERAAELGRKVGLPDEAITQFLQGVQEPGKLADLVAGYLDIPATEKQALLETLSVEDRLRRVLVHVQRQIEVLSAQEDIQSKVKEELGGRQREMYLREQMKAIQKELGEGEGARRRVPEGAARQARQARPAGGGAQGSGPRVGTADADRARVHGIAGHPHLPRDDRGASLERPQPRITWT